MRVCLHRISGAHCSSITNQFTLSQQAGSGFSAGREGLAKPEEAIQTNHATLSSGGPRNPYILEAAASAFSTNIKLCTEGLKGCHAVDAEMDWLYGMLYDDGSKRMVEQTFTEGMRRSDPLVLHLYVSRAPCHHCSCMIIAKESQLEQRFGRRVEVIISAVAQYLDECVGLAELSKDLDWLTFIPDWVNLSRDLQV